MKERANTLKNYFGLFHGESHTQSELTEAKAAIDVLVADGKAIEQLALDGDNLIYIPNAEKKKDKTNKPST